MDLSGIHKVGQVANSTLGLQDYFGAENFCSFTLDGVFQALAADIEVRPVLAFPKSRYEPDKFDYYDGKALDACIEQGAFILSERGLFEIQVCCPCISSPQY